MTKKEWQKKVDDLKNKERNVTEDQELERLYAIREFDEEPKSEAKGDSSKKKSVKKK